MEKEPPSSIEFLWCISMNSSNDLPLYYFCTLNSWIWYHSNQDDWWYIDSSMRYKYKIMVRVLWTKDDIKTFSRKEWRNKTERKWSKNANEMKSKKNTVENSDAMPPINRIVSSSLLGSVSTAFAFVVWLYLWWFIKWFFLTWAQ